MYSEIPKIMATKNRGKNSVYLYFGSLILIKKLRWLSFQDSRNTFDISWVLMIFTGWFYFLCRLISLIVLFRKKYSSFGVRLGVGGLKPFPLQLV